jgi:formiminoglutamase
MPKNTSFIKKRLGYMEYETTKKYYFQADPTLWQGRQGEEPGTRMYHHVQCLNLLTEESILKEKSYALLGFASDEGVRRNQGRPGALEGPKVLKQALAKLPYHGETPLQLFDCGEIRCDDENLEAAQEALGELVQRIRKKGAFPIILGGGHEVSWGHYQGIRDLDNLGIINFDAHFDLRPLLEGKKGSSGTPFLQIANDRQRQNKNFDYLCLGIQKTGNSSTLFKTAQDLGVKHVLAEDFFANKQELIESTLKAFIESHDHIYLTLCLDVFAEAVAPGVSAPQALGLQPWHVLPLLSILAKSGKIVSFDIAEMSPPHDRSNITAQLGATLAWELLSTYSMKSKIRRVSLL